MHTMLIIHEKSKNYIPNKLQYKATIMFAWKGHN